MKRHNPVTVVAPFSTYTQGVEIDEPVRFLFGAGQVGVRRDGTVGEGIEEQTRIVWYNITEILASAEMDVTDIVQLNMLLLDPADRDGASAVRSEVLGDHRPASTLMYVVGLAGPEWRIEVDFIAAHPIEG